MKKFHYLSRLDHLRFYAAILLVFHHFSGGIQQPEKINSLSSFFELWVARGATGVSLFLVLSGFLFCIITDAGKKKYTILSLLKIEHFGFFHC